MSLFASLNKPVNFKLINSNTYKNEHSSDTINHESRDDNNNIIIFV